MYFITTKRMLEVCFFQHTPTFIIEPLFSMKGRSLLIHFFRQPPPQTDRQNHCDIIGQRLAEDSAV